MAEIPQGCGPDPGWAKCLAHGMEIKGPMPWAGGAVLDQDCLDDSAGNTEQGCGPEDKGVIPLPGHHPDQIGKARSQNQGTHQKPQGPAKVSGYQEAAIFIPTG